MTSCFLISFDINFAINLEFRNPKQYVYNPSMCAANVYLPELSRSPLLNWVIVYYLLQITSNFLTKLMANNKKSKIKAQFQFIPPMVAFNGCTSFGTHPKPPLLFSTKLSLPKTYLIFLNELKSNISGVTNLGE